MHTMTGQLYKIIESHKTIFMFTKGITVQCNTINIFNNYYSTHFIKIVSFNYFDLFLFYLHMTFYSVLLGT